MSNRTTILLLATFTLTIFPLVGWLIFKIISEENWTAVFFEGHSIILQICFGSVFGFLSALGAWYLIRSPFLLPVIEKYGGLIKSLHLKPIDIIYISLCAGIGEELLFRASIQPFLGIWITSILFVALHGYLNPFDWRVSVYGIYMTAVIVIIAYELSYLGIYASIASHVVIDMVLLFLLSKMNDQETILKDDFPIFLNSEEEEGEIS